MFRKFENFTIRWIALFAFRTTGPKAITGKYYIPLLTEIIPYKRLCNVRTNVDVVTCINNESLTSAQNNITSAQYFRSICLKPLLLLAYQKLW